MSVPPQCQHDTEKTVYDLRFCMMTHEESHVVRWLKNGTFMLDIRLGCPSICKKGLSGTFTESFFGAATFLFVLDSLCLFLTEAIFSFNFWETASIVSLGEAKNGFIFGINFWLRVWSQNLSFLAFVAGNSRLTCVERDRMRAE